jgi:pilus assembly protein Flp/PilA
MAKTLRTLVTDQSGATAIEYGFLIATCVLVIVGALSTIGTSITGILNNVAADF